MSDEQATHDEPAGDEPAGTGQADDAHSEAQRAEEHTSALTAQVADLTAQVRTLRLQAAFNQAAHTAGLTDTDAAWKLAADDLPAVNITDDGKVDTDRMSAIVGHVAERYPYLATVPAPPAGDWFPPTENSGRPWGRRPGGRASALDQAALEARFPALRRAQR